MSVRGRSWSGAVLVATGVIGMVIAMLSAKADHGVAVYPAAVLWMGIALAIAGVGMIFWALSGAVRQIGASEAQLEARLRSEADTQREQKRPS